MSFLRDPNLFSYMNGYYKAKLDHCLTSSDIKTFKIIKSEYIDDDINLNVHKPLLINIKWNENIAILVQSNNNINRSTFITLPPSFDNEEIKEKFNHLIENDFENYINMPFVDSNNKQLIIDTMYEQ